MQLCCHGVWCPSNDRLKDRLSGGVVHGTNIGSPPHMTKEEEMELVDFLMKWSKFGSGKTIKEQSFRDG